MPENIDLLRELFDEKLRSFDDKLKIVVIQHSAESTVLNARMTAQDVTLARIEAQTMKTNGRVTTLEQTITNVQLDETNHILNCPQKEVLERIDKKIDDKKADTEKKLEELNVDLREYRFFKKYPKIAIGVLAFTCVIMVLGTYATIKKLDIQTNSIKANGVIGVSSNLLLKATTLEMNKDQNNAPLIDSLIKDDIRVLDSLIKK
jgi:hypothetical protein